MRSFLFSLLNILLRFTHRWIQHIWLGLFVTLQILHTNLYYQFFITNAHNREGVDASILCAIWWGIFCSGFVSLFPDRVRFLRRIATYGVVILFSLMYVGEHILIAGYKTIFSDSIAVNLLATNPAEAHEFLSGTSTLRHLPLLLLYLLIIGGISYGCYWLCKRCRGPLSKKRGWLKVALLAVPLGYLGYEGYSLATEIIEGYRIDYPNFQAMSPPARLVVGFKKCIAEMKAIEGDLKQLRTRDCGTVIQDSTFGAHTVVLVIGESATRDYHHCYGYPLANTPYIDRMVARQELVLFDNAVAPAPHTASSLSKVLTFYELVDSTLAWNETASLFNAFKQVGYYSFWLSNQEKQGLWIQPVSAIASSADSMRYTNVRSSRDWWARKNNYDEDVLPHLLSHKSVGAPSQKIFQVVHIMGSHPCLTERYPPSFDRIIPNDIVTALGDQVHPKEKSEYANTILYTDYILYKIIQRYAEEEAIVIYVADHGILVYDAEAGDMSDVFGHAPHWKSLSVPFMVYVSPKMRQRYPDVMVRLEEAKHRLFTTDVLPKFLCSLLGIRTSKYPPSPQDPLSPNYIARDSVLVPWEGDSVVIPAHK